MLDFKEWIEDQLNEECSFYNPEGNSTRAVVQRWRESKLKSIKFEIKEMVGDVKYELTQFDGFSTSIGWFIQWLLIPAWPLILLSRTHFRYKRAMSDYSQYYAEYKTREERNKNKRY